MLVGKGFNGRGLVRVVRELGCQVERSLLWQLLLLSVVFIGRRHTRSRRTSFSVSCILVNGLRHQPGVGYDLLQVDLVAQRRRRLLRFLTEAIAAG